MPWLGFHAHGLVDLARRHAYGSRPGAQPQGGACDGIASLLPPSADLVAVFVQSDNSNIVNLAAVIDGQDLAFSNFSSFESGPQAVTFVASDPSGNRAECTSAVSLW